MLENTGVINPRSVGLRLVRCWWLLIWKLLPAAQPWDVMPCACSIGRYTLPQADEQRNHHGPHFTGRKAHRHCYLRLLWRNPSPMSCPSPSAGTSPPARQLAAWHPWYTKWGPLGICPSPVPGISRRGRNQRAKSGIRSCCSPGSVGPAWVTEVSDSPSIMQGTCEQGRNWIRGWGFFCF